MKTFVKGVAMIIAMLVVFVLYVENLLFVYFMGLNYLMNKVFFMLMGEMIEVEIGGNVIV